ncbi:hypothetical protein BCR35DRAFT_41221 [Leucosporidium creatinivorum]|uniref:C3H1-type domain-containing protein n=1 Tax=Leucosporidium creatinivorum TaxID=106004 RepID=A0A1Y2C805_9BASI|nr:hypothetical protein BCR35DRAFT_41221 [Leucosporidium creatinivorum]
MPTEDPQFSLQHVGNGTPCRYFNQYDGQCLAGSSCAFMHAPDENSLRLKLDGGNICEAHLVRIGGCTMGNRCWYSHDLENGAGFPVDDLWAMKEVLEKIIRMRKDERRQPDFRGDFVKPRGEGPACLDFGTTNPKGGDVLLKELGGRRPQGGSVRHPHGQAWHHQQPLNPGEEDTPMSEEMKAMFAPPPSRGAPPPRRGGPPHRRPPQARPPPSVSDFEQEFMTDMAMYGVKPGDDDAWASSLLERRADVY